MSAITPPGLELPAEAAAEFDATGLARRLLRGVGTASLATLDPQSGYPLTTLVNIAALPDGSPLLYLSGLALHTRNLRADPRACLLIAASGKGDPLAHPRLSVVGRSVKEESVAARERFLARHPKAALYVSLPDFAMWRFNIEACHLNGGFARARQLTPEAVLTAPEAVNIFSAGQTELLARLGKDYRARLARHLQAAVDKLGFLHADGDGLDLEVVGHWRRLDFGKPAANMAEFWVELDELLTPDE